MPKLCGRISENDRPLLILSFSFLLLFVAMGTTQNLVASLIEGSLGTVSLGVLYIMLTVSSLVAPRVIAYAGVKKSINFSMITYVIFVFCNIYPSWFTLIPAAALLGFGAAVLWSAHGLYISALAPTEKLANRATGIFYAIYQTSQVFGNGMAFGILRTGSSSGSVPETTIKILFGAFTLCAICATALSTLLKHSHELVAYHGVSSAEIRQGGSPEPSAGLNLEAPTPPPPPPGSNGVATSESVSSLQDPISDLHMGNILFRSSFLRRLLLVFWFSGMEAAFVYVTFTTNMVKPVLGEANIPLIMMVFGVIDSILSWVLGKIGSANPFRAKQMVTMACCLQILVYLYSAFLFEVEQLRSDGWVGWVVLTVIAAILGLGDASFNTMITAVLASTYSNDKHQARLAFSQFKLWQSLTMAVAFFYAASTTLAFKSILTAVFAVFALFGVWSASSSTVRGIATAAS